MADGQSSLYVESDASRELIKAIEGTWRGIKINRLRFRRDDRSSGSIGYETYYGVVAVELNFSGEDRMLAEHGLVSASILASLPHCGAGRRSGLQLQRGKRVVRVSSYFYDPELDHSPRSEAEQNIWDRLAEVVATDLWQPRLTRG